MGEIGDIDISIIIVNYNTFELSCICIDTVLASNTTFSYEIILVDNASTDMPAAHFIEKYPDLVLLQTTENIGFGRANNLGMNVAKGNYILLLNSDTEIGPNVLERAMQVLIKDQADLYSCAQTMADGSPIFNKKNSFLLGHSLKTVWYNLPFYHLAYFQIENPIIKEIIEANTVSGAFMMMRREVYDETHGFDPDFFLYSEETEWCYNRIRKQFKIIYDPHNQFIHKQGASSNHNMTLQQFVSCSLGFYKEGYGVYFMYLFLQYGVALPMNVLFFILSKKVYKQTYKERLSILFRGFPYLFYRILRFSNNLGARKEFLIVDELKKIIQ